MYIYTHIYLFIYVDNILYDVSTPTCFDVSHYLNGVIFFYFAKVTKIIKVTNSIKSVD